MEGRGGGGGVTFVQGRKLVHGKFSQFFKKNLCLWCFPKNCSLKQRYKGIIMGVVVTQSIFFGFPSYSGRRKIGGTKGVDLRNIYLC